MTIEDWSEGVENEGNGILAGKRESHIRYIRVDIRVRGAYYIRSRERAGKWEPLGLRGILKRVKGQGILGH